jgi:hypothetical protein
MRGQRNSTVVIIGGHLYGCGTTRHRELGHGRDALCARRIAGSYYPNAIVEKFSTSALRPSDFAPGHGMTTHPTRHVSARGHQRAHRTTLYRADIGNSRSGPIPQSRRSNFGDIPRRHSHDDNIGVTRRQGCSPTTELLGPRGNSGITVCEVDICARSRHSHTDARAD